MVSPEVIPLERDEQRAFFELVKIKHPEAFEDLWSNGNGAHLAHGARAGKRRKQEGLKAGVPDIFFAQARGGFHGLFIELKRRKHGKISDEQLRIANRLIGNGYAAKIVEGCDEAYAVFRSYLSMPKV